MANTGLMVPGLVSGLSTSDIIQKTLDVERMPLQSLQSKKDQIQKKSDALRDINTRLSSLLAKIQALNLRSTVDAKTVTTDTSPSDPTLVTGPASPSAVGNAVSAGLALASAGFSITPTTGTFSVNGAQITIDSSTVLSDGADAVGANTIFAKIRDATSSLAADKRVTVAWALDGDGRQNKIALSATGSIQLGAGADTSNFLSAAGLSSLPPSTTMTSSRNLGGVKASALLDSSEANLRTALGSSTGTFKINGVEISYDSTADTLNAVISRINSSSANVIATFDSASDRITLTNRNMGSTLISLEDVTGNFLASMRLSASNETVGTNASYLLNGQQRYSSSNTVTDALAGVTLSFKKEDDTTDVKMTVGQDTSGAVNAVQDFVNQFNSAMSLIRTKTAYNTTTKKGEVLTGDVTVQGVERTLGILAGGYGEGLSSAVRGLADIGITTGSVGSAVGSTRTLVLDSSKLTDKLRSNPSAVADVFGALTATTTLGGGGTGSIYSVTGTPSDHRSGTYSIVSDASGNLTSTFTPTSGSTTTTTGSISASGTNTTLIPGLTLTAKGTLAAGTDTITTTFTQKGVGVKLADYLNTLTSSSGIFSGRQTSLSGQVGDLDESIQRMQTRLDTKEKALYAKFRGLEMALARLQGQSSSLSAQVSRLNSSR